MHIAVPPSTPALAPFVESLWYFTSPMPAGRELVLPNGAMQLLVNLNADELGSMSGAAVLGARSGAVVVDTVQQRAVVGVAFRPGGAHPFLTASASAVADQMVELSELWGRAGVVLRAQLLSAPTPRAMLRHLERVLLAHAVRPLRQDPAIRFALVALERGAAVMTVAERLGITSKSLGRRFVDQVGLSPKRFSRVRRFQRLLTSVTSGDGMDWAQRAAALGYYDQSHLIHDFRALSGLCPSQYRPRSSWEHNHVELPVLAA